MNKNRQNIVPENNEEVFRMEEHEQWGSRLGFIMAAVKPVPGGHSLSGLLHPWLPAIPGS